MKLGLHTVSFYFGIIMIVLVVSGAIAICFTDFLSDRLHGTKRIVFVIMLLAYAVYRGFRMYQLKKNRKNEE